MRRRSADYLWSVLVVAVSTGVAYGLSHHVAPTNLVMIYLLGVVFVAARFGRGPSIVASLLSVALFDFLFVPPYYSMAVDDTEYLLTFAVMLVVAILTSGLMLRLAAEGERAAVRREADRLRETLLRSVSHDFRTPLATIAGAASALVDDDLEEPVRREMLQSISEEAERLNRYVNNLLNMTRLEAGALQTHKEWHPLDEVVGAALTSLKRRLGDRPVHVRIANDLPLVLMDGILIEQVLVNLLDNAIRHAGSASPIEIDVVRRGNDVEVAVADRGPGLPVGNEAEVFDRFGRYSRGSASAGVGLGLAICRGVIEAHGGVIRGENRLGGGARFSFTLPIGSNAPRVLDEDEQSHRVIDSRGDVGSEAPGNVA